jgi:hypothetical protein
MLKGNIQFLNCFKVIIVNSIEKESKEHKEQLRIIKEIREPVKTDRIIVLNENLTNILLDKKSIELKKYDKKITNNNSQNKELK